MLNRYLYRPWVTFPITWKSGVFGSHHGLYRVI